ncbi:MAG TPA: hypothetical protein PKY81_02880 [bacterium]|nr:hypothetical protein [bacterium]HPN29882.1 hypothetical protein [bacterium]
MKKIYKKQPDVWTHPGGKMLCKGAETLTDAELISILLGSGIKGKPAIKIAEELLHRFDSIRGLANQSFEKVKEIKGLGERKIIRLNAALELARRIVHIVFEDLNEK